ncbi:MAG: hypothetical protein H0W90_07980 [Actinobacteria bacterium]|nr:hypothetical protein [Actinomycetota bacterium]
MSSTSEWRSAGNSLGSIPQTERIPLRYLAAMRGDPILAFGLLHIKAFLCRAAWHVDGASARQNAFVDAALRRIYGRFVLAYCGSLDWGFAPLVKNFERSGDPRGWSYVDGDVEKPVWTSSADALVWKPVTPLDPRKCSPHFASDGSFDGIDYGPTTKRSGQRFPFEPGGGEPSIPLQWALWATNDKDAAFGSLYGRSRLASAYPHWSSYWYRWQLGDRAFERWADPPVVAYHPSDVALDPATGSRRNFTAEGLGLAERLRSGANVSLPGDAVTNLEGDRVIGMRAWELSQLKSEVDFAALTESNEYLDVAKLRAVLVPEQAFFEGAGGTSSRNVASTLGDVFENSQATLLAEIHWTINRYLIPQLIAANFGDSAPSCEIAADGFDANDVETSRQLLQALSQNAPERLASVDERGLLERLNVPQKSPEQMLKAAEDLPTMPYDQETDPETGVAIENGRYRQVLDRLWTKQKGR